MISRSRPGRILPGFIALGILLVLLLCAAGCTQPYATTPTTTTTPAQAGLANPASVYCGQAGGNLEIKTDATGGQYGMCTFANGTTCEEWALLHGEGCKAGVTAATTTAAADGKKMVTFTEADNGKTSDIAQGTKFAVVLKENPTTGYQWNATLTKGLELVSDNYETSPHAEGMVGVGGAHTWVITTKDLGAQKFSAVYKRSWEPTTGNETAYSVTLNVVKI